MGTLVQKQSKPHVFEGYTKPFQGKDYGFDSRPGYQFLPRFSKYMDAPLAIPDNALYLAVLPLVHYSKFFAGETYEEVMTLVPDRNFATEFLSHEADKYIETFRTAARPKLTGRIERDKFLFTKYQTENGRVYVVAIQNV
ncbi:MAG TPA: hypothetical protein VIX11_02990 [Candidatus Acidoferrum sp.]